MGKKPLKIVERRTIAKKFTISKQHLFIKQAMSSVFDLDSEVLPIKSGTGCLWSPPGKAAKSFEEQEQHLPIKFSPPTSKEAYQRIRNKYQVALSVMDKGTGIQVKRTQVRRRQSFAISQMLQNVSTITSTPLKLGQLDADKLVETMKQSAIKQSALKRKSLAPRSCRKSRVQVLRRVSKNIDDIFASHFAEGDVNLIGATPHQKGLTEQRKGVQLLERFDDDPFHSVNFMEDSPERSVLARPSLAGFGSPTVPKINSTTPNRLSMAPSTPQTSRNQLCSPPPSKSSMSQRKSVNGSAIKLRDADFVTSSRKSSVKPPVPSSTPTRVLASNRKSLVQSVGKPSLPATPTRVSTTNTPAGRSPLTYYTAAASARRPTMPTPVVSTMPQRRPAAMTCSALKLKQLTATPLTNLRNTIQTQVHLSVEKMGALLQSMKKNDARSKHASLTVSKARESSPGLYHTTKKSSTARVLDYSDAPSATKPTVSRTFVYDADEPDAVVKSKDQEQQEEDLEDMSGMLDEVLDINIEAMLQDYAASGALAADRFSDAAELPAESEKKSKLSKDDAKKEVDSVADSRDDPEPICEESARVIDADEFASQSCAMDVTACEMDVTSGDMNVSSYAMDCTACSPAAFDLNTTSMEVDSPGPVCPEINQTLVCDDDHYASDSSSSPQIVRVRYSTGNGSRRSLSNMRGRVSLGAIDCLALAATESTSPLVFTAPAAPSDLLSPALVNSARADLNKCLKAVVTPSRSMSKGPMRMLPSASKAVTPQSKHRMTYNSDSDNELSLSCQSTGKKVIRNVNQHNANGRRKSLSCATSATVSNFLKKFQARKENQEGETLKEMHNTELESSNNVDTTEPSVSMTSIPEMSPRLTRSAAKSTPSALKAKELMAQSLSPRREKAPATPQQPASRVTTQKKLELLEQVADVAQIVDLTVEEPCFVKKGRKSTAKKSAKSAVKEAAELEAAVPESVSQDAELSVPVTVASSPLPSNKKTTIKKSVLKALASPAATAPSSTTRSYSLRSAAKNVPVPASISAEEDFVLESAQVSANRTVKTLFPEESDTSAENVENAAPSNSVSKMASTPLGKPMRVTATAKKLALKTPQGMYTAAKAKRQERNQKLDALFGTCEELLSMIDASVL